MFLQIPDPEVSSIEYRMIGGISEFYFFSRRTQRTLSHSGRSEIGSRTSTRHKYSAGRFADLVRLLLWADVNLYHATEISRRTLFVNFQHFVAQCSTQESRRFFIHR
ncbi:hypothetical protein BDN67DRAFT_731380 [Paxillus ammoniavirescens]|nr:hypothetical protein BDN67DRAFT_731380 [Paxillus ammoniavirescens]